MITIHFITRDIWVDIKAPNDIFNLDYPWHNDFECFIDNEYVGNIFEKDIANAAVIIERILNRLYMKKNKEISKLLNISRAQICRIINNIRWKHLKD